MRKRTEKLWDGDGVSDFCPEEMVMGALTRMRMDGCSGPNRGDDNKRDETSRQRNFKNCEYSIEVKRLDAREKNVWVRCCWWVPHGRWKRQHQHCDRAACIATDQRPRHPVEHGGHGVLERHIYDMILIARVLHGISRSLIPPQRPEELHKRGGTIERDRLHGSTVAATGRDTIKQGKGTWR